MLSTHIIIVNYNAGQWLARALDSALKFSHSNISVVDNASTDTSIRYAQSLINDGRIDWQLNARNIGFAAANNQVLTSLDSDYVLLMNPDCELSAQVLDRLVTAMQDNPQLGLLSCLIKNQDGSVQATCRRRFPTPKSALYQMLQLHRLLPHVPEFQSFNTGDKWDKAVNTDAEQVEIVEAISGAFMLARVSAVQAVGLLDEDYFMHCEDLDWCKRFAMAGWQVGFLPSVSVLHAKGVSSQSRPLAVLWTLHKGMNRFFDKFYQTEYPWLLRTIVKIGIVLSFIVRAVMSLIKRMLAGLFKR